MIKFLAILSVLFIGQQSNAILPHLCPELRDVQDGLVLSQRYSQKNRSCSLRIKKENLGETWRIHSFSTNGMHMIFNNFGNGPASTDTGARVVYYFPRLGKAQWAWQLRTIVKFSTFEVDFWSDGLISLNMNLNIEETEDFDRGNNGGITIHDFSQGIYLDAGFVLGRAPIDNPNAYSEFVDPDNNRCRVQNSDVFDYVYAVIGGRRFLDEVYSKFDTFPETGIDSGGDRNLAEFLTLNCPHLTIPQSLYH